LLLEGSALNFSSPRINRQRKAGKNNKIDITTTPGLVQVWVKNMSTTYVWFMPFGPSVEWQI
jgi:hypothetical protein